MSYLIALANARRAAVACALGALCFQPFCVTSPLSAQPASVSSAAEASSQQRAHQQDLWEELYSELERLGERLGDQSALPQPSLLHPFRNNTKKNQKKIDRLTLGLMSNLGASPLDEPLKKRAKIVRERQELQDELVALDEQLVSAPKEGGLFEKTKEDITSKIKEKEQELATLNQRYQQLMSELRIIFESMGVKLSQRQVDDLFGVISGESMRLFFVQFSNLRLLSDVIAQLIAQNQTGRNYSKQAKRYYAVYLALVHMLIEAHEVTQETIKSKHMPRVQELITQTQAQISATERLLADPQQAPNKATYTKNVEVQRKLYKAAKSYEGYLFKQAEILAKASADLRLRLSAVLNTYQTVTLSASLVSAIQAGVKDISDLQNLTLPELVPLSDDQLQGEFKLITGELEGNVVQDWRER